MTQKFLTNTYVSKKLKKEKYEWWEHDLMMYIDDLKFKHFVEDLDAHFSDAKVSNFDIIHHQWWGDPLQYSKCYYEITFNNDFQNFEDHTCNHTILSAIKAERDEIHFECDLVKSHIKSDIEKDLISNGIFIRKSRKKHTTGDSWSSS